MQSAKHFILQSKQSKTSNIMAYIVNFSNFTFSAEQIRDINELVFDELLHAPELGFIHTLFSGIVYDKEIGFISGSGLVGKKGQGCSPETQDWDINTRKVLWEPKEWEVFIDECANDIKSTAAVYALNKGTRVDDLTDTDYMAIVVKVLADAVKDFMYRLAWYNDTDADNVDWEDLPTAAATEQTAGSAIVGTVYEGVASTTAGAVRCALADGTVVYLDGNAATGNAVAGKVYYSKDTVHTIAVNDGGIITSGVDTGYFDIINGLWKQIFAAVAGGAKSVAIAANAKTTKSEQLSSMDADAAYALLSAMYYKAPVEMRGKGTMRFLVTQSIADAYQQYLTGKGIESTYKNLVDGIQSLSFLGVPVIPMPIWDNMNQSFNDLGTTFYKPHRAVLVEQANLAVGTPSEEAFGEFDIWYDKTSRKNYVLLKDKFDAKLLNDGRIVVGL